jgi:arylsulfatase A-like enzyme
MLDYNRVVAARVFTTLWLTALVSAAQTPVILISVDTLRADHLSSYGYRKIKTPNIDSFADHGTLYTDIESQIPLTLPSHTSLFTSTYPFQTRIEENAEHVPSGLVTLAGVLRGQGYQTAAFIGSVFLERQLGLDQGFETYDSPFHFEAFSPISGSMFFGDTRPSPGVREKRDGALVVRAASQWLESHRNQPVFAFVHLFDLHKPYDPHQGFATPSYDTELLYLDGVLGGFKKTLVDAGWWDRSVVVLLSDHGESLGEHGEASHGVFIYQSTVWTPLLIHWPAASAPAAARVSDPAGLIDVAPTILDAVHVAAPASFEGKSLLAASTPRAVYTESLHTHDSFGWAPLRSVRMGKYKYIEAPRPELYDLQTDPRELRNIYRRDSTEARALQAQLHNLLAKAGPKTQQPASVTMTPQTKALLGSLGYLAGSPRTPNSSGGPDPKDRLPELQLYEKSQVLLYYGRLDDAIVALREIVKSDPGNTLAQRDLGAAYVERKQYKNARAAFEKVLAVAPADYMTEYEMGLAEEHLGLVKEAIAHVQTACRIAPEAVQCRQELAKLKSKPSSAAPESSPTPPHP